MNVCKFYRMKPDGELVVLRVRVTQCVWRGYKSTRSPFPTVREAHVKAAKQGYFPRKPA